MAKLIARCRSAKRPAPQLIKLKDINQTVGACRNATRIIQEGLPNRIVFQDDPFIIAFHSLSIFSFGKGKYNVDDRKSVERQCSLILHKFGFYENGRILAVFKRKEEENDCDPVRHFVINVVGFQKMPSSILVELEAQVRRNLRELLSLIAEYETDPVIIDYKRGDRRPEHRSKVLIDFYLRCLTERDTIVNYLANALRKRAIVKASQDERLSGFGLQWFESYWDRPYRWWQYRSIEFFDYRKINLCRHRLGQVSVRQIPAFETLYIVNKRLFYRKLKKITSPEVIFNELKNFYIPVLPKVIERKPVFEELEKLLRARCWYGFTALALTQVEGVFSDMLYILYPKKGYSSLSTKVLAVRPHYAYEERNLDYFEYHLPYLRNSFLHSGSIKGSNFKLIAFDLLYDLHYLLNVFQEISDPHMELHKMLLKGSTDIITGLKSLNYIFSLIKEVRDRSGKFPQHQELKHTLAEWDRFEKDIFIPSVELEYYVDMDMRNIDDKIGQFFSKVKMLTAFDGCELDLTAADMKYITGQMPLIKQALELRMPDLKKEYEELMNLYDFMQQYKNYLPNCPKSVVDDISDIQSRHKINFAKLRALRPVFTPAEVSV